MIRHTLGTLGRGLVRFHHDEGGSGTVEFMLFVPFIFAFFLSSFEMGMLMVRQTMLDRGVDLTVRLIRLNQMVDVNGVSVVNRVNLRRSICFFSSGLIPDCDDNLRVEMIRMDPHNWAAGAARATAGGACVDLDDPARIDGVFDAVAQNELIILRVCGLVEPLSLTDGLGAGMWRRSQDKYALFSMSAFVVEPEV